MYNKLFQPGAFASVLCAIVLTWPSESKALNEFANRSTSAVSSFIGRDQAVIVSRAFVPPSTTTSAAIPVNPATGAIGSVNLPRAAIVLPPLNTPRSGPGSLGQLAPLPPMNSPPVSSSPANGGGSLATIAIPTPGAPTTGSTPTTPTNADGGSIRLGNPIRTETGDKVSATSSTDAVTPGGRPPASGTTLPLNDRRNLASIGSVSQLLTSPLRAQVTLVRPAIPNRLENRASFVAHPAPATYTQGLNGQARRVLSEARSLLD